MQRRKTATLLLSMAAMLASTAWAEAFPSKPVTIVVPFAPGGSADSLARLLGNGMSRKLGVPVVVDNRVGASGQIGASAVARSPGDGYTLLMTTSSVQVIGPLMVSNLTWDPVRSFTPIRLVAMQPQILVASHEMKADSLGAVLDIARRNPGQLNFSSLGPTTNQAISMMYLNTRAGVKMTHVPYSSAATMYPDIVSGRIDLTLDTIPNALPFLQKGSVRALAVTSAQRIPTLPDVPTVAEAGVPNFQAIAWFGVVGPAGIAQPVLDKLSVALNEALDSPDYANWLRTNSALADPQGTPASFAQFIQSERDLWKSAIAQSQTH